MKLNGREYKIPEIKSYKDLVVYEAKGLKLLALASGNFYEPENMATSVVRGISYLTGMSFEEALDELSAHIDNGGDMNEVFETLTKDIESMKEFGAKEGFSQGTKVPQDHLKKAK